MCIPVRLALKFHPDKVLSSSVQPSSSGKTEDVNQQFQKIGFAYAVLSDEVRRRKFDSTGSTRELMFGEGQDDFDWNEYFKTLWTGEVSRQSLDDFKQKYQNSEDEKEDIISAYQDTDGDLGSIFEHVPCCEFLADEQRFISIIDQAIEQGELSSTDTWTRSKGDKAGRKALRQKAKGEAAQAEKLARELGVWDDLFGDKSKPASQKKRTSNKDKKGDDQEDTGALAALIQRKNSNRASGFDDMIARLEARSGSKNKPPTDEEFNKLQAEILARKNADKTTVASKENKRKSTAASSKSSKSRKSQ